MAKLFSDLEVESSVFIGSLAKNMSSNPGKETYIIEGFPHLPIIKVDEHNYIVVDYDFERRLGTGALGSVYQSRHISVTQDIVSLMPQDPRSPFGVVKISHEDDDPNKERSYHHETKMLRTMGFTSVEKPLVHVLDNTSKIILPMKRLSGMGLTDIIAAETLDSLPQQDKKQRLMQFFYDLSKQVANGHQKGIAHLDINPNNIIVSPNRQHASLVDYQCARRIDPNYSAAIWNDPTAIGKQDYTQDFDLDDEQAVRWEEDNTLLLIDPKYDLYELAQVIEGLLKAPFNIQDRLLKQQLNNIIASMQHDTISTRPSALEVVAQIQNIANANGIILDELPTYSTNQYNPTQLRAEATDHTKNNRWARIAHEPNALEVLEGLEEEDDDEEEEVEIAVVDSSSPSLQTEATTQSTIASAKPNRWASIARTRDSSEEEETVAVNSSSFTQLRSQGLDQQPKVQRPNACFPFIKYPQLAALNTINPTHEDGKCFEIHNRVYEFLVLGKPPVNIAQGRERPRLIEQQTYIDYPAQKRWGIIEEFLNSAENGSVYAVNADSHAFNLFKIDDKLFLIDASFGVYKEITQLEDFIYTQQDKPANTPPEVEKLFSDGQNMLFIDLKDDDEDFSIAYVGTIKPTLLSSHIERVELIAQREPANENEDNSLSCVMQ